MGWALYDSLHIFAKEWSRACYKRRVPPSLMIAFGMPTLEKIYSFKNLSTTPTRRHNPLPPKYIDC